MSERKTQEPLVEQAAVLPTVERLTPRMVHAFKWSVLLAIAGVLLAAERHYQVADAEGRPLADRRMLTALAELIPNVPEAKRIARQLAAHDAEERYNAGLEFLKQGDAASAIAPLREAVELDPNHFQAHLQLGDALLAVGKAAAAIDAFSRAVELRPKVPDARVGLADAQIKAGRLDAAEATLRAGLAVLPKSAELNYTLGLLLEHSGRSTEAAPLLRRAEELGLSPPK